MPTTHCNLNLLQQSLGEQLTQRDEELLAAHLTECEACRDALEKLAADGGSWQHVGRVLREETSGEHGKAADVESTLSPRVPHSNDEAVDDATLTRSGLIAGTPHYMSPEQARGDGVDARSDLFSLGSVLYAMSTGRPPFRAETTYGILRRVTDETARPMRELNPEVPVWFDAIVMKLLTKSAAERFESAEQVAGIFEECLGHLQQPTVCPLPLAVRELSPAVKIRPWKKLLLLAGAVGAFISISDLAVVLIHNMRSDGVVKRTDAEPAPIPDIPSVPWNDGLDEDII